MTAEMWMLVGGLVIAVCAGIVGFILGAMKAWYEFAKIFMRPMG